LKFFQDGGGRHLGFVRTGNTALCTKVHRAVKMIRHAVALQWIQLVKI